MTQVIRICKYGSNTQLDKFDVKQNKFLETDGTLHTKERCQELKQHQNSVPNNGNGNDISVQVLLKKLSSIGIEINLEKLRNTVNGDNKK